MKDSVVLSQLRKLVLRMLADSRGRMAELGTTVASALEEMDAAKQDKITGTRGQVAGFDENGKLVAKDTVDGSMVTKISSAEIDSLFQKYYRED